MRWKVIIFLSSVFALVSGAPRMSIGELFGSHYCGSCQAAHAFLSAYRETFEDRAVVVEFHIDDDLQIDGARDRYDFYSDYYIMGYIPHMFINGENDSSLYYSWINRMTSAADTPAVVGIEPVVHEFDSAAFKIFVDEDVAAERGITDAETYLVISVLVRDSVPYEDIIYNFVATRFYTDPNGDTLILAPGDTAEVGWSFDLDPEWDTTKCFMVVYVVGPEMPYVANAYRLPVHRRPDYDFLAFAEKHKAIAPVDAPAELSASLVNAGELDDEYTVSLIVLDSCGEWEFGFGGAHTTTISLSPLDTQTVEFQVVPHSVGTIKLAMVLHTDQLASRYDTIYFAAASRGIDNLIVQECPMCDSTRVLDYFAGRDEITFYWNTFRDGTIGEFSLWNFRRIIWLAGEDTAFGLDAESRAQLVNYITSLGGKVLISGANVGYRASGDAGFFRIALGANFDGEPTAVMSVHAGDVPQFSGWNAEFSDASRWEAISGNAAFGGQTAFYYNTGDPAGLVKQIEDSRVVFVGFDITHLYSESQFTEFMDDAIAYLDGGTGVADEKGVPAARGISASPNPFNSACRIEYSVPEGVLEISDINGQIVERHPVAGDGTFLWTPKNLPSGIYFVVVRDENYQARTRVILIK